MAPGTVKLRESLQQSWRIYLVLRLGLGLTRIFHKLAGFFTSGTVLEEKSGWTALVFRFRRNLILIVL
jgi:hypothetical protein